MNHVTKEQLIAFEAGVRDEFAAGRLPFLVHLCGGNEDQLIEIFDKDVREGDWIFSTHRNHYHYLLAGGSENRLMELIRDGRSMFVFDRELHFVSSSILGGLCGVAAGVAWQEKQKKPDWFGIESQWWPSLRAGPVAGRPAWVWCFIGDGAEDNGHLYEAVMWVQGNRLPCTFIIEDNDRSVDVPISQRTGGFRMEWPACVRRYHYVPTYPHAGAGLKTMIEFDPEIVKRHACP